MSENTKTIHATREEWLLAAIDQVRPTFAEVGHPLPTEIRVSVGFGYGARAESRYILAQTWATVTCADNIPAVFISPMIEANDDALAALLHELVHVADDCISGHSGRFVEIGKAIGLEGKPTQMLPGVAMFATVVTIAETLGHYPHAALDPNATRVEVPTGTPTTKSGGTRVHTGPARQTNRHYKAVCMNAECPAIGYLVRTSNHWLTVATPICPVCKAEMTVTN
jgi:hypothetical protein